MRTVKALMGTSRRNSSNAKFPRRLAVNREMKNKTRSAQAVLRLNQQNAHAVSVLTDTGNKLMQLGEPKQARECFQDALDLLLAAKITLDKRTAIAYYNLARAHAALDAYEAAIHNYRKAIEIRPRFPEAHNNLGMLLNQEELFEQAIEHFKIVVNVEPLSSSAHYGMGVAYQSLEDTTTAAVCYQRAITLNPDFYASWVNLGLICYQIGSAEVAVHCYNEAIGLSPGNAELYFQLGMAYMMLRRFSDAARAFTKAIELEPWHKEAKDALEEALFFSISAPQAEAPQTA